MPSSTSVASKWDSPGPVPGMSTSAESRRESKVSHPHLFRPRVDCSEGTLTLTAMIQPSAHRSHPRSDIFGDIVDLVDFGPLVRQSGSHLVHEHGSGESTTTDQATLRARDGDIVPYYCESERLVGVGDGMLLLRQTEEEDVARAGEGRVR